MEFQKEANRIYMENEEGKVIAEITFPQNQEGTYVINHTFVDDCLRGQGIAGKLVEMAIEEIQKQGGTVAATCSYAVEWMKKHQ